MFTTPVFVLHAFGRQLPLRARLFIDFLVEAMVCREIGALNFRNRPETRSDARAAIFAKGQKAPFGISLGFGPLAGIQPTLLL